MSDQITVTLWPRIRHDLDRLRRMGLWGSTVEEVAHNLIVDGVKRLIAVKMLPMEYAEAETAAVAESGDWLTASRLETIRTQIGAGKQWRTVLAGLDILEEIRPTLGKFKLRLKKMGIRPPVSDAIRANLMRMRAALARKRDTAAPAPAPVKPKPAPAKPPPAPRPVIVPPAAAAPVSRALADMTTPINAESETIRQWGAQRGIGNGGGKLDLAAINATRRRLQLPPFELVEINVGRRY